MRMNPVLVVATFFSAAMLLPAAPVFAQSPADNGKLHIHVSPRQAYVFVDGKAIRDGSQTIELAAGTHKIGVYNYGYTEKVEDVQIESGKKTDLDVTLQANGNRVSGLAYNRRVDIVLEPQGQQSAEIYPNDAPDARILWARKEPSLKRVEEASKTSVSVAQAQASPAGK